MDGPEVGVLTIVDLQNYGNRLQNHAVHKIYGDFGIRATTIEISESSLRAPLRNAYYSYLKDLRTGTLRGGKYKSFAAFTARYAPFITVSSRAFPDTLRRFDFFSVGSDQVWNPNDVRLGGSPSGIQLLQGVPKEKKVTLAPSFGVERLPVEWIERYRSWLDDLPTISVREVEGARVVEQLTGRSATVLTDPTMAVGPEYWRSMVRPVSGAPRRYGVKLFLGATSARRRQRIEEFADSTRIDLVDLKDDRDPVARKAGPQEFLSLVANARVVFTDSFHCAVFAFMLDSPVVIFPRSGGGQDMSSRLHTFSSSFGLQDRFYLNDELPIPESMTEFDYGEGHERLAGRRREFLDYLRSELDRVVGGSGSMRGGEL